MSRRVRTGPSSFLFCAAVLLSAAGPAIGQELRQLQLDDGRVVTGKIAEKGDTFEVETREGLVVVPAATVEKRIPLAQLREQLEDSRKAAGATPFANLQLAIDALGYGLETEMWKHLDLAIEKQAELTRLGNANEALGRRIKDFAAQLEPEILPRKWRTAGTDVRVKKLLEQVRIDNRKGKALAIEELLAREPNAEPALRNEIRRDLLEERRIAALHALARRAAGQTDHIRFVLRTAILDRDQDVRTAAAASAREIGAADEDAVQYLAAGLSHPNAKVRIRTAEAYAELGNAAALPVLVGAGPTAGRALVPSGGGDGASGARAHMAVITQQAYIRDFDVEVAQAAFIADPKVDVLQSGTVLDVTVQGIWEERVILRAYRAALKSLGGSDPGADPLKWPDWLRAFDALQKAPTQPVTGTQNAQAGQGK